MRTILTWAAAVGLLAHAAPGHALDLTPPPMPDCSASARSFAFLSTVSLVALASGERSADGYCAGQEVLARGQLALPLWIGMLNQDAVQARRHAAVRIRDSLLRSYDNASVTYVALADIGYPDSAVRRFIDEAPPLNAATCGGGAGYLNDAGAAAIPRLAKQLRRSDTLLQSQAALCLAELGVDFSTVNVADPALAPDLQQQMQALTVARLVAHATEQKNNAGVAPRRDAALAELELRGEAGAQGLVKVVTVWNVRHKASASAEAAWMRRRALGALAAMGDDGAGVFPQLARLLNDPELGPILGTAGSHYYLPLTGVRSRAAQEQLLEQTINNRSASGRWYAGAVLADMGPLPPDMLPALRKVVATKAKWEGSGERASAPAALVAAIAGPGRQSAASVAGDPAAAAGVIKTHHGWRGAAAAQACQQLAAMGQEGIAAVLPLLRHSDHRLRRAASDLLGAMGPAARHAATQMSALLRDAVPLVRRATAENIGRITQHDISTPELLLYLLNTVTSASAEERVIAAGQLRQFPRLPEASLPQLRKALRQSSGQDHQDYLLYAIAATGSDEGAHLLVDHLVAARTQWQRDSAAAALRAMGPAAMPVLLQRTGRAAPLQSLEVRAALASVLASRAQADAQARATMITGELLPALETVIGQAYLPSPANSPNNEKRRAAARHAGMLALFSPQARALALPLMGDPDVRVQALVIGAMARGEPDDMLPLMRRIRTSSDTPEKAYVATHVAQAVRRLRVRRCVGQQGAVPAVVLRCATI